MKRKSWAYIILSLLLLINFYHSPAQNLWHGIERTVRYTPSGNDFVIVNGERRFNRALYGTNTGFRVEAGDLPEFALYMPGMGGCLRLGWIAGDSSLSAEQAGKWLINANYIKANYRPGSMLYEITDPQLGKGILHITVLALADKEGMIVRLRPENIDPKIKLCWMYGGASGKKFSRDGDIGADPESSFYLQPDYCKDNTYRISSNTFSLSYGSGKVLSETERYEIHQLPGDSVKGARQEAKQLAGVFPINAAIKTGDASAQQSPLQQTQSTAAASPVISATLPVENKSLYFLIQNSTTDKLPRYDQLGIVFDLAETARKNIADRVKVNTPDAYINTLGGALSIAADAIWESPSYLHGAVAWRMRLNAWRGAYVADPLGWHDRARSHFSSYAKSQVISPVDGPVVFDTALHLARQMEKMGTAMFSSGYISRNPNDNTKPHHYDMNLVFIDQLLNHFNYTGDTSFVKQMWPLIQRHLAWEKRNFDSDDDGLYDAYAAIWASDALQYSGGGVTHSSAYNYRSNKTAAKLAVLIGEDPSPYQKEADKIFHAMQTQLWMPEKGWYAEYKDKLGLQLLHPAAGLWTIYHAIDSKAPDAFQSYQLLHYVDKEMPHIPIKAKGLNDGYYLLSTTNWQPYTWSLNNVVMAENLHTSLAYWQGGRKEEAFTLWKSTLLESMYLGASPGNFQQLSFYDAIRGELYRDFADPIGIAARTLTEGLFGILPDALHDTLLIRPGFPSAWKYASLQVPDIHFDFKREGNTDHYLVNSSAYRHCILQLQLHAIKDGVNAIFVNGKHVSWKSLPASVGEPMIEILAGRSEKYDIAIEWKGNGPAKIVQDSVYAQNGLVSFTIAGAHIKKAYDPQQSFQNISISQNELKAVVHAATGNKTVFVQLEQGAFTWWQPIYFRVAEPVHIIAASEKTMNIAPGSSAGFEKINLSGQFNAKVTDIFKQQYLSPRPQSTTLQLPTQGIGNWCYPLVNAVIDDKGLRKLAGNKNEIQTQGIPFASPSDTTKNNIVFTSQWDNYPRSVNIPLAGKASHIYLLMAGSTDPMQSRMVNGEVRVHYTDGSTDTLLLSNPQNWWPIEEDYYTDGFAFTTGAPKPLRLYLKDGTISRGLKQYTTIKGLTSMAIDGGAATILDMPLQAGKELQSLSVHAIANDVVIGLMSATLVRNL